MPRTLNEHEAARRGRGRHPKPRVNWQAQYADKLARKFAARMAKQALKKAKKEARDEAKAKQKENIKKQVIKLRDFGKNLFGYVDVMSFPC